MSGHSRDRFRLDRRDASRAGTGRSRPGGCVPVLPGQGPAPRTFRVTPKYTFDPDLPAAKWSLAVAEPVAERTLDTDRIAVVTNGIGVDYVALAFWVDRAPAMVQTLDRPVVPQLRPCGPGGHQPGPGAARLPARVRSARLPAQPRRSGPDLVRVRLNVQLLRMPRRDSVGRESFAAELAPTGNGIDAVVAAFDEALGKVLKELVAWTVRTGNRAGV